MRKSSIRRLLAENKRLKYELTSVVMAPLTIEAMAISTRIRQHESELSTYGFISDNLKNLSPMSDEQAEAFERVWRECPTKFELIPGLLKKREDDICKSITAHVDNQLNDESLITNNHEGFMKGTSNGCNLFVKNHPFFGVTIHK